MYQTYKANTKKCIDTKSVPHILFTDQINPIRVRLLSPATLLFNHLIIGFMPAINRPLIGVNNDDQYWKVLVKRQTKNDMNHDPSRNYALIPIGSIVAVQ